MGAPVVAHPTDQALLAYGKGWLDADEAGAIGRHLATCAECRRRAATIAPGIDLGRLREAAVRPVPMASAAEWLAMPGGTPPPSGPPAAGTMPPGLADHPDYRVVRELGRGAMGVVYLAENTLMGRPEVLKVVDGPLLRQPEVLDRFLREIRAAARLRHPNIVAAYSALRIGESLVLAMEYVEGTDLSRLVQARGPLPVALACHFIHQAAMGLQHAHECGMVHRDIKPANLILAREGSKPVVKVLDFGLAKVSSEGPVDSGLTREGQMLGTPDFIAPEQIRRSQSADIRADIYSLGGTLYFLLKGGPPFVGDNLWDLYQAHLSRDASPLHLVRPDVPVELAALVAKMMAKDPSRRFQTPGEVARALVPYFRPPSRPAAGPAPVGPPPLPATKPKASDGVAWDTLIAVEAVPPTPPTTRPSPDRHPPWKSWPVAAGAVAVFVSLLLAILIAIKIRNESTRIKAGPEPGGRPHAPGVHRR